MNWAESIEGLWYLRWKFVSNPCTAFSSFLNERSIVELGIGRVPGLLTQPGEQLDSWLRFGR
jgi:hypothetical protein